MQRFYEWRCKFSQKAVSALAAFFATLEPNKQNPEARKAHADLMLGQGMPFLYAANNPDVRVLCCCEDLLTCISRSSLTVGRQHSSSRRYLSILQIQLLHRRISCCKLIHVVLLHCWLSQYVSNYSWAQSLISALAGRTCSSILLCIRNLNSGYR